MFELNYAYLYCISSRFFSGGTTRRVKVTTSNFWLELIRKHEYIQSLKILYLVVLMLYTLIIPFSFGDEGTIYDLVWFKIIRLRNIDLISKHICPTVRSSYVCPSVCLSTSWSALQTLKWLTDIFHILHRVVFASITEPNNTIHVTVQSSVHIIKQFVTSTPTKRTFWNKKCGNSFTVKYVCVIYVTHTAQTATLR